MNSQLLDWKPSEIHVKMSTSLGVWENKLKPPCVAVSESSDWQDFSLMVPSICETFPRRQGEYMP